MTVVQQLNAHIQRYPSLDRLMMMRNVCFGSAAACLIVLIGSFQATKGSTVFGVSTACNAFAIPLWLIAGMGYENYIFIGKRSYAHFRTKFVQAYFAGIVATAGILTWVGVGTFIDLLSELAAVFYVAASLVAIVLGSIFHRLMATWWCSNVAPTDVDEA
jgi:hypothetical protein